MSTAARVGPDMMVRVSYRLFDANGQLVDEVPQQQPLAYVHGYAQIIPGLEAGLTGAQAGETRELWMAPDEAFGERDEGALLEIDRHDFPDAGRVSPGDELLAMGPDGQEVAYRVVELTDDSIIADLNHPLAGQRVRFAVRVLSVDAASDEQLDAACADMDERIVYDSTIVYGSGLGSADEAAPGSAAPPSDETSGLVQLRRSPSFKDPPPPAKQRDHE